MHGGRVDRPQNAVFLTSVEKKVIKTRLECLTVDEPEIFGPNDGIFYEASHVLCLEKV